MQYPWDPCNAAWHAFNNMLRIQEFAAERAQRTVAEGRLADLAASEQRLQQQLEQSQAAHQAERREAEKRLEALQGESIDSLFAPSLMVLLRLLLHCKAVQLRSGLSMCDRMSGTCRQACERSGGSRHQAQQRACAACAAGGAASCAPCIPSAGAAAPA